MKEFEKSYKPLSSLAVRTGKYKSHYSTLELHKSYTASALKLLGYEERHVRGCLENGTLVESEGGFTSYELLNKINKIIKDKESQVVKKRISFIIFDEKTKKQKLDTDKLAEHLLMNYHFKSIESEKGEIYYYDNEKGIYSSTGKFFIQKIVQELGGKVVRNFHITEIIGIIKRNTYIEREELYKTDPYLICLKNGILDLRFKQMIPHSPGIIFTQQISIIYNPQKKCPNILKLFSEMIEPTDMETIQEFIGMSLFRSVIVKKAMILNGPRDTGKSTFIKIIQEFIGHKNCSEISLQDLCKDKFAVSGIEHKLLNFYDDLSANDVNDVATFKVLTGMGWVDSEKKFGDRYSFKPYAKHLFGTNKIPDIKDKGDEAYFSRWEIINFNKQIDNDKQDPNIVDETLNSEELSGFLNWVLLGFDRLIKNKKMSSNKTAEEIQRIMEYSSNPVKAFIQDCIEQDSKGWISKEDFYSMYVVYAQQNGFPIIAKQSFGKKVLEDKIFCDRRSDCIDKKSVTGWGGIILKSQNKGNKGFHNIICKKIKIQHYPKNDNNFTFFKNLDMTFKKVLLPLFEKDKLKENNNLIDFVDKTKVINEKCHICQDNSTRHSNDGKPLCNDCGNNIKINGRK